VRSFDSTLEKMRTLSNAQLHEALQKQ
jgi:hypothetical protein